MRPLAGPIFSARSIISSHVLGGVGERSVRYQRNCVFDQIGVT